MDIPAVHRPAQRGVFLRMQFHQMYPVVRAQQRPRDQRRPGVEIPAILRLNRFDRPPVGMRRRNPAIGDQTQDTARRLAGFQRLPGRQII